MTGHRSDEVLAALQAAEGDAVLVTAYVAIVRTTVEDDVNAVAYRIYYHGSLDERLGLLEYATIRARRLVASQLDEP